VKSTDFFGGNLEKISVAVFLFAWLVVTVKELFLVRLCRVRGCMDHGVSEEKFENSIFLFGFFWFAYVECEDVWTMVISGG